MTNSPKEILIHCSDVSKKTIYDQFASINAYHRDVRGFLRSSLGFFVGYHRLITGGKNYKCKEDFEEGCHCNQTWRDGVSMNLRSLGVCVGFDGDIEQMDPDQYQLLQAQVFAWMDRYSIPPAGVKFHRDYEPSKTCPGSLLDHKWLAGLLDRSFASSQVPPAGPPQPEIKPAEQCAKQEEIISKQTEALSLYQRLLQLIFGK